MTAPSKKRPVCSPVRSYQGAIVPYVPPLTHVLFDFFGTLVSYSASRVDQGYPRSHDLLLKAGTSLTYQQFLSLWDLVFREFDEASDAQLIEFSMDDVCEAFLRRALHDTPSATTVRQFRDVYLNEWNKGVEYIPGASDLLADLHDRYALVLVTNTHHAEVVFSHLSVMDITQYFSAVVTSVEYGKKKPSPELFSHALSISGGIANSSVHVGDSFAADYKGAASAGIDCFLIDPCERFPIPQSARINHVLDIRERLLSRRQASDN